MGRSRHRGLRRRRGSSLAAAAIPIWILALYRPHWAGISSLMHPGTPGYRILTCPGSNFDVFTSYGLTLRSTGRHDGAASPVPPSIAVNRTPVRAVVLRRLLPRIGYLNLRQHE